mmetsp:Transcript_4494/g.3769  ORF Transcript_4494/g.3769 Transcript_4494/m.3769 type:complete len:128 (+) Transcript_4494:127-510(+)
MHNFFSAGKKMKKPKTLQSNRKQNISINSNISNKHSSNFLRFKNAISSVGSHRNPDKKHKKALSLFGSSLHSKIEPAKVELTYIQKPSNISPDKRQACKKLKRKSKNLPHQTLSLSNPFGCSNLLNS